MKIDFVVLLLFGIALAILIIGAIIKDMVPFIFMGYFMGLAIGRGLTLE